MNGDPRDSWPSAAREGTALLAALLLLPALLAGCQQREGGDAEGEAADTAAVVDTPSSVDTTPSDTAAAARADTPTEAEPGEDERPAADTAGRYYVRVLSSADPREVAARHGIEPREVITEPTRAFYAALTYGQRDALQADTLVRSLAREIH